MSILPTQYLDRGDVRLDEPHKRLMMAVLLSVVDDCRGTLYRRASGYGPARDPSVAREAAAYMASTDRAWPFSFENICEALGVDPDFLRAQLG